MRSERTVTFLLLMAAILTLRAGVVEGAELAATALQQSVSGQVHVGEGQVQDPIRIDMSTGAVTRGPARSSGLGARSTSGGPLEEVYSSLGPSQFVFEQPATAKWGDLLQLTRGGALDAITLYITCYGNRTLTTAKLRIRVYDGSVNGTNWPTYPAGTPDLLLSTFDTPTLPLNMVAGAFPVYQLVTFANLSTFPNPPLQVPQNVLLTVELIEATPAQLGFTSYHRGPGTPATIGSSGPSYFADQPGGYVGMATNPDLGSIAFAVDLVCGPASIVSPTTLDVSVPSGGAGGGSIDLVNTGCTPLTYSIAAPALMSVSPSSGTVAPGGGHSSFITVTPGIVPVGFSGFGDVVVTTNDPITPTRTVRVNYTVPGSPRRATPGVCYATQGNTNSPPARLYRVDLVTGAATAIGPTSGVLVPAMAIEPREGRMFALAPGLHTQVDPASGGLALVSSSPCATAMTFSPSGQLLRMGCDSTLYVVDPNTGSQVAAGQVSPFMNGMAFDPTTGFLYGVRTGLGPGTDKLYRITFPGGATTLIGSLGLGLPIGDITFDESGNLFGVVGENTAPNQLVSIDKTTGAATVIGATGVQGLSTLAYFAPTVHCRFATSVTGFSSQFTATDFSAAQALGTPNVYPAHGSIPQAWASATPDGQPEYLQLGFDNPAPINFVNVYETLAPGALRSIRVKNPDTGLFETVWSGTPAAAPAQSRVFTATFPVTRYPVSEVYLEIASDVVFYYNEIDAVSIGYRDFRSGNQWASQVLSFSSQYSPTLWSAQQALGAPNIFPRHENIFAAWASETPDGQREYLELGYANPVPINHVNVVESYLPGALDRVSVWNPNTLAFEQVWSGTAAAAPPVARIHTASFPLTRFPVSRVRLEFDSPAVAGWNEVDAVGIGTCDCSAALVDAPPSSSQAPARSGIEWARPSPFAGSTTISLSLARAGRLEVEVFDLHGKRVASLMDGQQPAGRHEIRWDGRDGGGRAVASGVYYLRMKVDGQSDSRKVVKIE